ncbi:MAG: thioesterase family protein [Chitinophagales bacterium]|nr:thioesterase family protein [Chitinophagales bacterium]
MEKNRTEITVRGYHLDLYRHVNNARYLEFLEEARWRFFEEEFETKGFEKLGLAFVIVNININYRYPASLGQVLDIRTSISHIGNKSMVIKQTMALKETGQAVVDADVTVVMMDMKTGKATALEGPVRAILERLV